MVDCNKGVVVSVALRGGVQLELFNIGLFTSFCGITIDKINRVRYNEV